jgi:hypothetical protein
MPGPLSYIRAIYGEKGPPMGPKTPLIATGVVS